MSEQEKEKFQNTLTKVFTYGRLGFGLALAKDVGILDVLCEADTPLTSVDIADKKKLKERYVRELLGCLCGIELVQVQSNEAGQNVYHISPEGKEILKNQIAGIRMTNAVMEAYKPVRECCKLDGPYGFSYGDELFHTLDEKGMAMSDVIIEYILSSVPNLKEKLERGIKVAEFGSGSGRIMSRMATMFPKSTFLVSEYRQDFTERLRETWKHIPNMRFEVRDICAIPEAGSEKFDWINVINVIHDLPYPLQALKAVRCLTAEPDGVFTSHEVAGAGSHKANAGNVQAAMYYALGTFLCIPESFQKEDSVAYGPCWGRDVVKDLGEKAGFNVEVKIETPDACEALFICRPAQK